MTSLCRHLSAQEIVNWVTTADGCLHTADTTQLDSFVASASAVCIGHNTPDHNTSSGGNKTKVLMLVKKTQAS